MLIQIDSKKLQAFLKDVAEVYAMIGGDEEIGKESAVKRMNTVCAQLDRRVFSAVHEQEQLEAWIDKLHSIYKKLEDTDQVDRDIESALEEEVVNEAESLEKSQRECLRSLLKKVGYTQAKKIIDVESDPD